MTSVDSSRANPLVLAIASRIVETIRQRELPIGHRLTEQSLCSALGVSRSPIRKALQLLEASGVVASEPNKGFHIARVDSDAVIDLGLTSKTVDDLCLQIARDHIDGRVDRHVSESSLLDQYGLTRPLLQRVLNQLSRDGLLDRNAGRGWTFRPLVNSIEAHRESYRFRMILEPAALLEPGYAVNLQELDACEREQKLLLENGIDHVSRAQLFAAGSHLHETLVAGAKNRFALDALRNLNQLRKIAEYGSRFDQARLQTQCEEHLFLIDLVRRGERMEASLFLRQHLDGARASKVGTNELAT